MEPLSRAGATLGALPTLPVFFKLRGRRVVLAGGGEPAVWKAEVLCAAGAQVDVFARDPCAGLEILARDRGEQALRLIRREWQSDDLAGAALALGAIEDEAEGARFRSAAVTAGVPVNVVDKPALCDFQFGTLVDRSPLVLAITTDGAAPVFGQAIRARIEALLPEGLRSWAEAAKAWRHQLQGRGWSFRQRRRFWEVFADLALSFPDLEPGPVQFEACKAAATRIEGNAATATVTLVGCGPGVIDAVTFGAVRTLQAADAIVYDPDVPAEIINLGRREAYKELATRDEGSARVRILAAPGRQVAWLGTGNAQKCSRWQVRADQLAHLPVRVTRITGVSECALCAGACPGVGR